MNEQANNATQPTLTLVDIKNLVAAIDYLIDSNAPRGWDVISQVNAARMKASTFIEAVEPTQEPEKEVEAEPANEQSSTETES